MKYQKQPVIWLYGLSGAGKTTLGKPLKTWFENQGYAASLIDGDLVRDFYDNDLGYSVEDRRTNIKRIMLAAHLLSENGIIPIVCNISPFEDLRRFAKKKFITYHQILLKRDFEDCQNAEGKDHYRFERKELLVGAGVPFEDSTLNSLVIDTDREAESESFAKLTQYCRNNVLARETPRELQDL